MTQIDTFPAAFNLALHKWRDKIFIEDGSVHLSYAEADDQAQALSQCLINLGIKPGDKIGMWSPNRHEWIIAMLASHRVGAAIVPINTRYKAAETETIVNLSQCKLLFSIGEFLETDYPKSLQRKNLPTLENIIVFGKTQAQNIIHWEKAITTKGNHPLPVITGDMVSDIIFTSGTTGVPKGVVTCHAQNIKAFSHFVDLLGLNSTDRYLILNPFFHSFGYKAGILACILSGATIIPEALFDVGHLLERIGRDKITVLPGPPTIFQSMLAHPQLKNSDISTLTKATTGAAVIPTQLINDMQHVLGIDTVITAYGLSESCGIATMCRASDSAEIIAKTSGRALPETEVAIMNEVGELLPAGHSGEIVVRGFNVMKGYLGNASATSETIDNQNWLHTGDIGKQDSQGNLYITDRLKDMFICGGFNCYPAEIESFINSHSQVTMCAVIGVPDDRLGEVGCLYYVTNDGPLDEKVLHQWCRENMANYKVPRYFNHCTSLPLTASGKVHKPTLREQWRPN